MTKHIAESIISAVKSFRAWLPWHRDTPPADVCFNKEYAERIGGYPTGVILASSKTAGLFWINTRDHNLNDPDGPLAGVSGWFAFQGKPIDPSRVKVLRQ